jgi:hypothetical protein
MITTTLNKTKTELNKLKLSGGGGRGSGGDKGDGALGAMLVEVEGAVAVKMNQLQNMHGCWPKPLTPPPLKTPSCISLKFIIS